MCSLHRQPKHLLDFLLAELGTSGSVDGNSQLIIKGRFQQKQIEIVLRRYIKEYVTCHTCRSPNTILQKDTRIFFLQCEDCGSRCSVASIKSGFQVKFVVESVCLLGVLTHWLFSGCHRKTCRHSSENNVSRRACMVEGLAGVHNAISRSNYYLSPPLVKKYVRTCLDFAAHGNKCHLGQFFWNTFKSKRFKICRQLTYPTFVPQK